MSTRMSSDPSIARDREDVGTSVSLAFGFGAAKVHQACRLLLIYLLGPTITIFAALQHLRRLQQFQRRLGSTDSTADPCSSEIP
jgi:hypothetical protein